MSNDTVKENSAKNTAMHQARPPFYDFVIEYSFIYMYYIMVAAIQSLQFWK